MSHACGPYTVDGFLEGKGELARALFRGFVALLERCGPIEPAPAKTRVAFMVRMRFASINSIGPRGMRIHFLLRRALSHRRIERVERIDGYCVHHLRVSSLAELDAELLGWLAESYRLGEQR